MFKVISLALLAIVLFGVAGCSTPTVSAGVVQSGKPRVTSPSVTLPDYQALVEGNNQFAFNLYKNLGQADGNVFYSPYSISQALAMTYGGAKGATETGMASALSFTLPQDRLHATFNYLDAHLSQSGQVPSGKDVQFQFHVVNAIWGQKDYSFLPQYLDLLAQNYGAGLRVLDFIKATEASRVAINKWVEDQTANRIKDLVPPGSVNEQTRLVLTNAIYFNASWQSQFKTSNTVQGTFKALNGNGVSASMMKQSTDFRYAEGADYQAVELPYQGNQMSMVLLVPRDGSFQAFEKAMDAATVKAIVDKLQVRRVNLVMPKFSFQSSIGLKQPLTALGMGVAFTQNADFSGIDGKKDLLIQDVLHKAFVAVDEQGTEAAAATAVIVGTTSMPVTVDMTVDHPFIFLIRDISTGSIIFLGRVVNPSAG